MRDRRAFLVAKLHSLTGLVPAGAFVACHLATNAQALRGRAAFDAAVGGADRLPLLVWFELLGLWIPLLFHGGYGLYRLGRARPNLGRYPLARNWAYFGQRLSGAALFLFLLLHLGQFRLRVLVGQMNRSDYFEELCGGLGGTGALGVPWLAIGYLFAIAAVSFHLSNGLYGFCCSWGITRSLGASRRLSSLWGAIGILLFIFGSSTVLQFATGWSWRDSDALDESPPAVSCGDLGDGQRAALERTLGGPVPSASTAAPAGRGE